MATQLSPGKTSSEFIFTLTIVVGFVILVALDKITITQSMMETIFQLGMVYIGGRAIPKAAEQLKDVGGRGLARELADALKKDNP